MAITEEILQLYLMSTETNLEFCRHIHDFFKKKMLRHSTSPCATNDMDFY